MIKITLDTLTFVVCAAALVGMSVGAACAFFGIKSALRRRGFDV